MLFDFNVQKLRYGAGKIKGMCRYSAVFGLIVGLLFAPAFAQGPAGNATQFGAFLNELSEPSFVASPQHQMTSKGISNIP
jgi:hypothetical protein